MANSKDVAALSGTSQSTVSRVFRNSPGVNPATADRVRAAAATLGYVPSESARALVAGKTKRIALIVERLTHPAFALMADLIHDELLSRGYRLSIIESDQPEGGLRDVSTLDFSGVDGVIFTSAARNMDISSALRAIEKPVVFTLRVSEISLEETRSDAVHQDHAQAAELAVDHLWSLGHRSIALISATTRLTAGHHTELGFRSALRKRGVHDDSILVKDNELGYEQGYEATLSLFSDKDRPTPTAIFAVDDTSAYGAIDATRSLGKKVPEDVSVVGFDDFDSSAWHAFSLTTIHIPHDEIASRAIDLLLERIDADNSPLLPSRVERLGVSLVVRGSTGPAPATSEP